MSSIISNGKMIPVREPIASVTDEGLRYGRGAFETIRVVHGAPAHFDLHMARLKEAISALHLPCNDPDSFCLSLYEESLSLIAANQLKDGSLRIQVFAANHSTASAIPIYVIQTGNIDGPYDKNNLRLTSYRNSIKSADAISHLKHCNYLPYILAMHHAQAQGFDDALVFNQFNRICESARANLFMISNGEIFTPPISEGCIAGIIRGLLMKHLLTQGWKLQERPIAEADLKNADEIFLTNSLRGIMQVACLDDKELKNNLTAAISVSFGEI